MKKNIFAAKDEKLMFRMNLQFFAEGEGGDEGGDDGGDEGGEEDEEGGKKKKKDEKLSYTQKELQRMMATEKNQGRLSVYKELGFEFDPSDVKSGKDAKKVIEDFRKWNEKNKTEVEKLQEKAGKADEYEKKCNLYECKFAALAKGVSPDCVDDVVTLALTKVTEDHDFKSALEEIEEKYPHFFGKKKKKGKEEEDIQDEEDEEDEGGEEGKKGTGSSAAGSKGRQQKESMGARLAKQKAKSSVKSSFYSR